MIANCQLPIEPSRERERAGGANGEANAETPKSRSPIADCTAFCYTPSARNGHSKNQGYVLPLHVEQVAEGRYLGRSPKLPGLNVQADSIADVVRLAPKVARSLLAAMRAKGVPPPRGFAAAKSPLRIRVAVRA